MVETASVTKGFGFRLELRPQTLFERHKVSQLTDGAFDDEAPDISGPLSGYGTFAEQYNRIEKALVLCDKAGLEVEPVLKSAS